MKKILFLSLLATVLLAKNPNVYSALGDVLYNNADKISNLSNLKSYSLKAYEIDKYLQDLNSTKEMGFKIEKKDKTQDPRLYLKKLRKLSKQNDAYTRSVYKTYKEAIKNENSSVVSDMINTGLLDTRSLRDEIMQYYYNHQDEMSSDGVVGEFLDEDAKLKEQQKAMRKYRGLTKEQLLQQKIRRLREQDKKKQEAIQKTLEEEVAKEKVKIRQEQVEELSK